jgi:hypothetical protein
MPRTRSRAYDAVEQDFLDAIDRLKAGKPQNQELREKVRRGKPIKINIATVAKEAGRARGLIARQDCRYPAIRQLVRIEEGVPGTEPRSRDDVITDLRRQVAELRVQLADAKDHAAHHLDFRSRAERKLAELQGLYERLRKLLAESGGRDQSKVVRLFPEGGDGADA